MSSNRTSRRKTDAAAPLADMIEPEAVSLADMIEQPESCPDDVAEPADGPTPEQIRIQELEHQLALERGRKDPDPVYGPAETESDAGPASQASADSDASNPSIVIHVLEDGLTAMGVVWYRGQELEFVHGGSQYQATVNKQGQSWLDLRHNEAAQIERWGKIMFRDGPWPGRSYLDAASAEYTGGRPTKEQLHHAQSAEAARRRAVPIR